MAVKFSGGNLQWQASLGTDLFDRQWDALMKKIAADSKKAAKEQAEIQKRAFSISNSGNQKFAKVVEQISKKTLKYNEELRQRLEKNRAGISDSIKEFDRYEKTVNRKGNVKVTDARARLTKDLEKSLDRLISKEKQLQKSFDRGKISSDQYERELSSLQVRQKNLREDITRLKSATDELNRSQGIKTSTGTSNAPLNEQQRILAAISNEYRGMMAEGLQAFNQLSPDARKHTTILQGLQDELRQITLAERDLSNQYDQGKISALDYDKAQSALAVKRSQISSNIQDFSTKLQQEEALLNATAGSINEKNAKLSKLRERYNALSEAEIRNAQVGGKLRNEIKALDKEVNKLNRSMQASRVGQEVFRQLAVAASGVFSIYAAQNFIRQVVRVRGEIQQLEVAFETLLKSKERADALLQDLIQFAATTPFSLTDSATAAKQLIAYGIEAENVTSTLRRLGDVAAGVSVPIGDIVYAYGTLRTQGRAYARDIRQFTGRGIPIIQELAKQFGVAESEVMNLVSAGKVGFKEIEKAFVSLTDQGGTFAGLMEKQSKTVTGRLERLRDAYQIMLNDIGESNEGLINNSISGLAYLVNNYQTVIDIIKTLIVSYGAYRAAIVVTTAVQAAQAASTVKLTAVQALYAAGTRIATRVQALFNASLLANPVGIVAAALAGLVTAIVLFRKEAEKATLAQQTLSDVKTAGAKATVEQELRLKSLIETAKNENNTLLEREKAIKKINAISPSYLGNLDLEKLKTDEAKKSIDEYIESLRERAIEEAAFAKRVELERQRLEVKKPEESFGDKLLGAIAAGGPASRDLSARDISEASAIGRYNREIEAIDEQIKALNDYIAANKKSQSTKKENEKQIVRSVAVIDEEINALKESQKTIASTKAEWQEYQSQIEKLEAEKRRITGEITKVDNKFSSDQKKILESLYETEQEYFKKGLSQDQEEIQSARDKFNAIRKEIEEYNKSVPPAQRIGSGTLTRIDQIEQRVIGTIQYDQDTERLKEALEKRKVLWSEYEQYRIDSGEEAAKEVYGKELGEFENFADELKSEFDRITSSLIGFGGFMLPTPAVQKRMADLAKMIAESEKEQKTSNRTVLKEAISLTESTEARILKIREKYAKLSAALAEKYTGEELNNRQKLLEDQARKELEGIAKEVAENANAFLQIGDQVTAYTKKQLRAQIEALEAHLKGASDLTDQQKERLRETIKIMRNALLFSSDDDSANLTSSVSFDLRGFQELQDIVSLTEELNAKKQQQLELQQKLNREGLGGTDEYSNTIAAIAGIDAQLESLKISRVIALGNAFGDISSIANDLSNDLQGVNGDLADTLGTLSQMSNVAANATAGIGNIAKGLSNIKAAGGIGDIFNQGKQSGGLLGGIGSVAGVLGPIGSAVGMIGKAIGGIVNFFKASKESAKKARQEIEQFYQAIKDGEREIRRIQRERELEQAKNAKGTLNSIAKQQKELSSQTSEIEKEYKGLLNSLAREQYVYGQKTEKYGGFLGIGRKTRVVDLKANLMGKSFEELEELFEKGQLTEGAANLFEQLQKLKQEGEDVKDALAELAEQAKEIWTGTTAESISDSIIEGFKSGYRTAEDFAKGFEDLMQAAMLNAFKYNYLEKEIGKFYEKFASSAENGGGLTQGEIEQLRKTYNQIIANSEARIKQIEQVTGQAVGEDVNSNETGLAGSLRREITEATATELSGRINGMYLAQVNTLKLAEARNRLLASNNSLMAAQMDLINQKLVVLNKIEGNTRATAGNTGRLEAIERHLKAIYNKMDDNNNALKATGR